MIGINKKCYECVYMKHDWTCADDYCECGNDNILFNDEDKSCPCTLFENKSEILLTNN